MRVEKILKSIKIIVLSVIILALVLLIIENDRKTQIIGSLVLDDITDIENLTLDVDDAVISKNISKEFINYINKQSHSIGNTIKPIELFLKHEYLVAVSSLAEDTRDSSIDESMILEINSDLRELLKEIKSMCYVVKKRNEKNEPIDVSGNNKEFFKVYKYNSRVYKIVTIKIKNIRNKLVNKMH